MIAGRITPSIVTREMRLGVFIGWFLRDRKEAGRTIPKDRAPRFTRARSYEIFKCFVASIRICLPSEVEFRTTLKFSPERSSANNSGANRFQSFCNVSVCLRSVSGSAIFVRFDLLRGVALQAHHTAGKVCSREYHSMICIDKSRDMQICMIEAKERRLGRAPQAASEKGRSCGEGACWRLIATQPRSV